MDRTSSSKTLSYWIVYGFSGGRLHGGDIRKELKAARYQEAKSMREADIIITHSAGYWLLTDAPRARIIMLIAPALPQVKAGRTYREANVGMWREARQNRYLHKRILWSLYSAGYLIAQPKHNRKLAQRVKTGDQTFRPPKAPQIVVVTNREDPWPRSKLMELFLIEEPWAFISLPGSHEHIKKDPAAYVAIINQYAKRLLAQTNA